MELFAILLVLVYRSVDRRVESNFRQERLKIFLSLSIQHPQCLGCPLISIPMSSEVFLMS